MSLDGPGSAAKASGAAGTCEVCGAVLRDSHVGRLCPACLFRSAIELGAPRTPDAPWPRPFGDYELLAELGRGGMGVVYRARQSSLDRIVALKVTTPGAADDVELRRRFRIEAAAAARLRHPGIVAIHDYGEVDDQPYYVMDLVAGRDLAVLCSGRPLEPRRAATLLRKIAQAVHSAHLAGVVHRDLKPSNVIVDDADEPHITDFGLAKRLERPEGVTVAGQVLGSPGYASPEQVAGQAGDAGVPSDIYSLGALGYHLVTGRAPFTGASAADALRAMLAGRVSAPRVHNPALPRDLERIILTCMEADPARRYPSAVALATDLERFLAGQPVDAGHGEHRPAMWRGLAWGAAGAVLVATVVAGLLWWSRMPSEVRAPIQATIELPSDAPLAPARVLSLGLRSRAVAISPDGLLVAYVAQVGETTQLYLRPLDRTEAHAIEDTRGAHMMDFSPDGRWIAFLTTTRLKKISVQGGSAVTLCEVAADSWGLVWGADDKIYVNSSGALRRAPAAGGPHELVPGIRSVRGISAGPGKTSILGAFSGSGTGLGDYRAIKRLDLQSLAITDMGATGYCARVLSNDLIVYTRGNGLFAARLGRDGRAIRGEPVPVLEGLQVEGVHLVSQYAVADNGTLVYVAGDALDRVEIVGIDRARGERTVPVAPRSLGSMEASPDGHHLAVILYEESYQVLVLDVETGRSRVLPEPEVTGFPVWSPDGTELVFTGRRSGQLCILAWTMAEPTRPARLVYQAPEDAVRLVLCGCFTDGDALVTLIRAERAPEFWRVPTRNSAAPELVPGLGGYFLQLSPDDRWLALTMNLSGRPEIHVQRFPDGPLIQVSVGGGEEPRWSGRGDELYYRFGDTWMVVPVSTDPEFRAGEPRELFRGAYSNVPWFSYAVAPGGDRVYVLRPVHPEQRVARLHLVLNWADEVQRRLARGR